MLNVGVILSPLRSQQGKIKRQKTILLPCVYLFISVKKTSLISALEIYGIGKIPLISGLQMVNASCSSCAVKGSADKQSITVCFPSAVRSLYLISLVCFELK